MHGQNQASGIQNQRIKDVHGLPPLCYLAWSGCQEHIPRYNFPGAKMYMSFRQIHSRKALPERQRFTFALRKYDHIKPHPQ